MTPHKKNILQVLHETEWFWLVEIGIGFVILLIFSLGFKKLMSHLREKAKAKKATGWQSKVDRIFSVPVQILIWGVGLFYILDVVATHVGLGDFATAVRPYRTSFIVACVGWMVMRWSRVSFGILTKKSQKLGVAPGTVQALSKLVTFVLAILTLLIIFSIFKLNIVPLLTVGGIGVAGIAFAAQDIIANFFGGAMLHFTRPFIIGETVIIPSQNEFMGTVEEIGWYMTMIRDFEKQPVYFPNALFSKMNVINQTRRSHRRIKETFFIRYEDMAQIDLITKELTKSLQEDEQIDATQTLRVVFNSFGDFGLEILIFTYTKATTFAGWLDVKHDVLKRAYAIVAKHGAEMAFPTQELHIKNK